ncbi:MAG: alpha/beta hydrolase [Hyphomicrobiaceae bacterium]|nr:alpha/beta hydrolase [Hyphomicrobiaceae bacterium]
MGRLDIFRADPSAGSLYSALVAEAGVEKQLGLAYGPHRLHRADVFEARRGAERPLPSVLFFPGGGWRRANRGSYAFVGAALAAAGVTTIVADYRQFPEVRFPAFCEDAALAYAWAVRRQRVGASRGLIVAGHSAGAHIAALIALDRRYLEAAEAGLPRPLGLIGLAGPYAFDPTTWPSTKDIFAGLANPDRARPVTFVDTSAPPALVMHGTSDRTVMLHNQRELVEAMIQADVPIAAHEFIGLGHVGLALALSRPFRWRAPVRAEMLRFVDMIARTAAALA